MGNLSNHDQALPLLSESLERLPEYKPSFKQRAVLQSRERLGYLLVISLQVVALLVLAIFGSPFRNISEVQCRCPSHSVEPFLVYSPAQKSLEYEIKTFTEGLGNERTVYQGYGDGVDSAWDVLYNHQVMKIPKSEAILLPNKTYPIEHTPGYYIASLDVFHQLHCLNLVRRALYKDHYVDDTHLDEEHVSHCVDSVRQSLMCNADISVNVWQWNAAKKSVEPRFSQAHSCRNFDKLRDWTRERKLHKYINLTHFVDDGLPDIPIIYSM